MWLAIGRRLGRHSVRLRSDVDTAFAFSTPRSIRSHPANQDSEKYEAGGTSSGRDRFIAIMEVQTGKGGKSSRIDRSIIRSGIFRPASGREQYRMEAVFALQPVAGVL